MQDYNINVRYSQQQNVSPTSPKYQRVGRKTSTTMPTAGHKNTNVFRMSKRIAVGSGIAVAQRISSYVGELTENKATASRRRTMFTLGAMGLAATSNPIVAGFAATMYLGDKVANYEIKAQKQDVSAEFLRSLSGGTVSGGR